MNLTLLSLVGLGVLLCGAVASLPQALRDARPHSQPLPRLAPLQEVWIVEAPADRWYLAGAPISRSALGQRLRHAGERAVVHFLPSAALTLGEVKGSLAWLRRQGSAPVRLELPPAP